MSRSPSFCLSGCHLLVIFSSVPSLNVELVNCLVLSLEFVALGFEDLTVESLE